MLAASSSLLKSAHAIFLSVVESTDDAMSSHMFKRLPCCLFLHARCHARWLWRFLEERLLLLVYL